MRRRRKKFGRIAIRLCRSIVNYLPWRILFNLGTSHIFVNETGSPKNNHFKTSQSWRFKCRQSSMSVANAFKNNDAYRKNWKPSLFPRYTTVNIYTDEHRDLDYNLFTKTLEMWRISRASCNSIIWITKNLLVRG